MKKTAFFCAVLSAVLLFTGCQNTSSSVSVNPTTAPVPQPTEPNATNPPTLPSDSTPVFENMYSISLPITTNSHYAEDGTLIYSYSYQTISPICQDRDVSRKIIMDFTDRIEKNSSVSDELLASAEAGYQAGLLTAPYSYDIHYSVKRVDQGVLSMYGKTVHIGNTPRASINFISANYNMVTGDVLTLGSILDHADKKDDLEALVISALESQDGVKLFPEFRDKVSERFDRDESTDEAFYFSENGLCFYFAPGDIANTSFKDVTAEIPYSKLTQIIADDYFPAERSYSDGTIQLQDFTEENRGNYQQFMEVLMAENKTKILLTTESGVQDIRIYELIWDESGLWYKEENNIYASNFLSSENAILLDAQFSTSWPGFKLTYSVNGETVTYYMTADASTGKITLEASAPTA